MIEPMIGDLGQWRSGLALEQDLAQSWHDDMVWWGGAWIAASHTIARYTGQHAAPFLAGCTIRPPTTHVARLAEGAFGGFNGWPNFTARPTGGFMGMPGTDNPGAFRVIDIYRRSGDTLADNCVFIDLLDFCAKSPGGDLLARTAFFGEV